MTYAILSFMFQAMKARLQEAFTEMLSGTSDRFIETVPQIVLTVLILIVGVVVAHVAYRIVLKVADFIGLDKLSGKVSIDRALKIVGIRSSISKILGLLVYWLTILFALLLLSEILDFGAASEAIGAIVAYIPHLIIGMLLLVVGLLIGRFFRDVVSTSLARAGVTASAILGHLTQIIIVTFACLLALRQIGFDVSIITTNIAVIFAVVIGSTGLAVALGVRPLLEQGFCGKQMKNILHVGDHVTIDGISGDVITVTLTHVILKTNEGDALIPARFFMEKRFTRRSKES